MHHGEQRRKEARRPVCNWHSSCHSGREREREMVAGSPSCHASGAPSESDSRRSAIDCLTRLQNTKYTSTMTSDPLFAVKPNVWGFFLFVSVHHFSCRPRRNRQVRLGLRAADVQLKCLRKSWQVFPLVWPNTFLALEESHRQRRNEFCSVFLFILFY